MIVPRHAAGACGAGPGHGEHSDAGLDYEPRPLSPCTFCVTLNTSDLALGINLSWLADTLLFGPDLSQTVQNMYANRVAENSQFYLSYVEGVGNPSFDQELTYGGLKDPDSGYQLLALFRFWNIVQDFYPNRAVHAGRPVLIGATGTRCLRLRSRASGWRRWLHVPAAVDRLHCEDQRHACQFMDDPSGTAALRCLLSPGRRAVRGGQRHRAADTELSGAGVRSRPWARASGWNGRDI